MRLAHVAWALVVGLVIGLLARAIMPGVDQMGVLATAVLGIAGSLVGGFLGGLISKPQEGASFHPAGFVMSVIGALVLLFAWNRIG